MESGSNPILVEVFRGTVLESFHRGVVCVVDSVGRILYSKGDVSQLCYPRSALKFFQQIPIVESGGFAHFGFTEAELSVMCGSHNGEPDHVEAVRSILNKIGLSETDLQCGPQYPSDKQTANALMLRGEKAQAIHNNCSGKHAGLLALSVFWNQPNKDYLNPKSKVQQAVKQVCAEMYEYPESKMSTALDGCSAPIFSMPVYNQAVAYKNLVNKNLDSNRKNACKQILTAVAANPFMLAGTKRYCTELMQVFGDKLIGKTGAEGVFNLAIIEEEIGVAIKIDDGKMQPQYFVAQQFLNKSGFFKPEKLAKLSSYIEAPVLNFNKLQTGVIRVVSDLFDGLDVR